MNTDILTLYWRTFQKIAQLHFRIDVTGNYFLILLLAAGITTFILGRLFLVMTGKSDKGFIVTFIAYCIPILLFAAGFTLSNYHLSSYIQDPFIQSIIDYTIATISFLIGLLLFTPLLLGVGIFRTIFVYFLMTVTNIVAIFLVKEGVHAFERGSQNIESHKKARSTEDIKP